MRIIVPARQLDSRNRLHKRQRKAGKGRRSWRRRLGRWIAAIVFSFVLATWTPVLALRWFDPPVTAFMLFNNPLPMDQTRHQWRTASALGDESALAVMAAEDQNFPHHHGLDLGAIAQAVEDKQRGERLRGASSISQQLAKNLFLWSGRSFLRKGLEAYFAVVIDLLVPKRRILELYLNIVELGPGLYGFPAASLQYFGVEPAAITPDQAALLAAVLPNPIRLKVAQPSAYVVQRQAWIADQASHLRNAGWLQEIAW